MKKTSPVFKYLFAAAAGAFAIGVCAMLADIYSKVGDIEHRLIHSASAGEHKH